MRELLADFSGDVRYALRQARKHLSLTIICAAVLAIGIGSTVAVFAILYDAILKPLPYRDASQLVYVHNEFPQSQLAETEESAPDFADLSTHHEIFSATAAYYFNDFTMTGAGAAQHVDAVNASATLFTMLGIPPELGRAFIPEEDHYGAAKVVILSDELWRSAFGADRNVLGRSITLDGASYQIIGVMPADFNFPYPATQMWVPLALPARYFAPDARGGKWLRMIARVAPGLTPRRANAALAGISRRFAAAYPDDYPAKSGWHFSCVPVVEQQTKAIRGWLLLAFGAVFLRTAHCLHQRFRAAAGARQRATRRMGGALGAGREPHATGAANSSGNWLTGRDRLQRRNFAGALPCGREQSVRPAASHEHRAVDFRFLRGAVHPWDDPRRCSAGFVRFALANRSGAARQQPARIGTGKCMAARSRRRANRHRHGPTFHCDRAQPQLRKAAGSSARIFAGPRLDGKCATASPALPQRVATSSSLLQRTSDAHFCIAECRIRIGRERTAV